MTAPASPGIAKTDITMGVILAVFSIRLMTGRLGAGMDRLLGVLAFLGCLTWAVTYQAS